MYYIFDYRLLNENEIVSFNKLEKLDEFLNNYITYIEKEINNKFNIKKIDLTDISSILLLLSECYDITYDKCRLEAITDQLIMVLKNQLYNDKVIKTLSFFGGLTDIGFSLKMISEKLNKYQSFFLNLNQLILSQLDIYSNLLEEYKEELSMPHYDFILGASGVLKYLLEFNRNDIKNFDCVENLIEYLHSLLGYKNINNIKTPNWYIKRHNNFPSDRDKFPEGSINYSLSHGIVAVLGVLLEASKKWRLSYLKNSLELISDELWRIRVEDNGIPYWPGMIPLENYRNNDFTLAYENKRMSWCYGSLGILLILEKLFSHLGKIKKVNEIEDYIIKIANLPVDLYRFDSPTICHGFSGAIVMLNTKYKTSKNKAIKRQLQILIEKVYSFYTGVDTGFKNIEVITNNGVEERVVETSHYLLTGTPGILLSLLSLIKPTQFQRHLLL